MPILWLSLTPMQTVKFDGTKFEDLGRGKLIITSQIFKSVRREENKFYIKALVTWVCKSFITISSMSVAGCSLLSSLCLSTISVLSDAETPTIMKKCITQFSECLVETKDNNWGWSKRETTKTWSQWYKNALLLAISDLACTCRSLIFDVSRIFHQSIIKAKMDLWKCGQT